MMNIVLTLIIFIRLVIGIVPDVHGSRHDSQDLISLPDLLQVKDITGLNSWEFFNNIKLDTGRLLLGKIGGAAWSKNSVPNANDEWTVEFVFRSSGTSRDLAYSDANGLSLFFVQDPSRSEFQNFGGPSQYDGFQFLLNTKDKQGLKIFSNDGSKKFDNSLASAIGQCEFSYLNSQVPFNLRVSYSGSKKVFKVQIDNNLCFKTDKISIPNGKYKLGIAGNVSPASEEVFEVLRLKTWDYLTDDAIDDHGLMSDGELKIAYETVIKTENNQQKIQTPDDIVTPGKVRESLIERNRRFREQMNQQPGSPPQKDTTNEFDRSIAFDATKYNEIIQQNARLQSRLDSLESILLNLQNNNQQGMAGAGNIDSKAFDTFQNTITTQYAELLESIAKLNQKVISEVREQQFTIDELGKKVDLLMSNHKEIKHQYDTTPNINSYENASNTIRYILIMIVIIVLVLVVFVYRLRHDIKHSKLL